MSIDTVYDLLQPIIRTPFTIPKHWQGGHYCTVDRQFDLPQTYRAVEEKNVAQRAIFKTFPVSSFCRGRTLEIPKIPSKDGSLNFGRLTENNEGRGVVG